MAGQQGGVVLDRAVTRDANEILRRKEQHIRHDTEVDIQRPKRLLCIRLAVGGELKNLDAFLLRENTQRVRPCARLFGRDEHAGDGIPRSRNFSRTAFPNSC
jgi:hypothetical protein